MKTTLKIVTLGASLLCAAASTARAAPVMNIVLVHGAWVDGSGWRPVYDILVRDGYNVSVAQHPLTGLDADVAATKRILERLDGPCILVGHSYGGAVLTQAGGRPPRPPPPPPPPPRPDPRRAPHGPTQPAPPERATPP